MDEILTETRALFNEAMPTGETLHNENESGSKVLTRTFTLFGRVPYTAPFFGKNTVLAQIFYLVQETQGLKLRVPIFAGYMASKFVPSDVGIATIVFSLEELGTYTRDTVYPFPHDDGPDYYLALSPRFGRYNSHHCENEIRRAMSNWIRREKGLELQIDSISST